MEKFASKEEEWRAYLAGTHPLLLRGKRLFQLVPSSPRCKMCAAPFAGPGRLIFGRMGFAPWDKHPGICTRCIILLRDQEVSGAEVEISFLFADVRRSSDLARRVGTMEFTRLMQRFYSTENTVLQTNEQVRQYLLKETRIAVVPFQAFGLPADTGWFRLSVGATSVKEIEEALPRVEAALREALAAK